MTRRDYERVADMIRKHHNLAINDGEVALVKSMAQDLAVWYGQQNPRFVASRFFAACGMNDLARFAEVFAEWQRGA